MVACASIGLLSSVLGVTPLKVVKSWPQFMKIVVLAAVFCLTVVLGNVSLAFIPVSFNQAIGSTTPFFTAILAFTMQGQREVPLTYASLIPIMLGVIVASGGEPAFNLIGFTCCLAATALRALKSVVQSMLMTDPAEKLDPMSLLLYMSGVSVAFLLPMAVALEPASFREAGALVAGSPGFLYWLIGNSCLAYFVNLTNFLVTKFTSALTLQVLGNAKGVVAAAVSVAVFRNTVTVQGCLGYAITVAGVFLYSESKRRSKAAAAAGAQAAATGRSGGDVEAKGEREPLLASGTAAQPNGKTFFRG
ncbi:hypothetical protein HYH02_004022 [Chlamydomonas schloesseri]|uniref:Sugar phosphate transporter domain-containing protein n=1 Tax=Chlamydomonas schloesseri TaxID=2026947 RepID=A0A835WP39_9CHLO|nr:hypothetical protein HYH02_004022 [Chlamydomonas schloesseri]|eukprot:KAG2451423.1 hypothetical protein HYH02_004022 [Chlamydomonas schloesseri]